MTNTARNALAAWGPHLAFMATIVGAAWGLAWSLGGSLARLEEKVEQNAVGIERNAQAIERNAQAIAKVQEAVANLAGQYGEHVRRHDEMPASR